MKKHLALLLLAGSLPFAAFAQLTVERCNQRCMASDVPLREGKLARYGKQLDQIRAQKKTETDPAKLKALEEQEQDVLEQGREAQQKFCTYICVPKSN
jgi:hypothetical protein